MKKNGFTYPPTSLVAIIAGLVLLLATLAFGAPPACTGDRHYDGVACCPVAPPVDACPTPQDVKRCYPDAGCPDPAPCPEVVCRYEGEAGDTTNYITVNRCPDVAFPNYRPCRVKNDGTLKCPRPGAPRRVLAPIEAR